MSRARYVPTPPPRDPAQLQEYLYREFRRVGDSLADDADRVVYRTTPRRCTAENSISANWKIDGNVLLISTSNTLTLTGLQRDSFCGMREVVVLNVGTGVIALKSEGTESSASNRFTLVSAAWQLSAGAAATLWRDPYGFRWRGISKTP